MSVLRRINSEAGFGLVEVLAASMVVIVGVLGTAMALDAGGRSAFAVQRSEQALSVAQREIEKAKALSYADLGMSSRPTHGAGGTVNPNHWVSGTKLQLPVSYRNAASPPVAGAPAGGEELVDGGEVDPGPEAFVSGRTRGHVYRYVSWRSEQCTVLAIDLCPGTEDTKRITVAVVLGAAGGPAPAPVWMSTIVADPDASPLGVIPTPPQANPGSGPAVTAQPFFLYDTRCSTTTWQAPGSDHATHDTGRSGAGCTGSTAADLMAPAANDEDPSPARRDFATDVARAEAAGIILRRPASGCPESYGAGGDPTTVHRWATAPFAALFATPVLGSRTAVHLWTRTADGQPGAATICARLHSVTTLLTLPVASGSFTLAHWPTDPTPVAFTLEHAPFTLLPGARLVLTLSLQSSSGRDVELRFDHPEDRTFISVATTTPLS